MICALGSFDHSVYACGATIEEPDWCAPGGLSIVVTLLLVAVPFVFHALRNSMCSSSRFSQWDVKFPIWGIGATFVFFAAASCFFKNSLTIAFSRGTLGLLKHMEQQTSITP
jgi:hypothetical protein